MFIRLILGLVGLLAVLTTQTSLASPLTERFLIGFSEDGSRFAFATYETSDAADFAQAKLFILDVASDTYAPGTPRTYGGEANNFRTGYQALQALLADPSSPLRASNIQLGNYRTLATHNLGQDGAPTSPLFEVQLLARPTFEVGTLLLALDEFEQPGSTAFGGESCIDMIGQEAKGFSLRLGVVNQDGTVQSPRMVYRDTSVPESRFCPSAYGLADVVVPFDSTGGPTVALVRFFQMGFEGNGVNYLAIPVQQP